MPVPSSGLIVTPPAVVTSSGSSQKVDLTPADATGWDASLAAQFMWRIAVAGSDSVYATFGSNPTATSTSGFLLPAGGVYEFGVSSATDKVAIINA